MSTVPIFLPTLSVGKPLRVMTVSGDGNVKHRVLLFFFTIQMFTILAITSSNEYAYEYVDYIPAYEYVDYYDSNEISSTAYEYDDDKLLITADLIHNKHWYESYTDDEIANADVSHIQSFHNMFALCRKCSDRELDLSNWDTAHVTDTSHMFYGSNFKSVNVSGWDVSKVRDMSYMFAKTTPQSIFGITEWNVTGVRNRGHMFGGIGIRKNVVTAQWK